jgi:hypothetical protein
MTAAYLSVTGIAAAMTTQAAVFDFMRSDWVISNMDKYGVPRSWLVPLGALKAAGAIGLLIGIGVPLIGIAAAVGLILFFTGAIVTVTRAHWYSHLKYPASFLLLGAGALALRLATV